MEGGRGRGGSGRIGQGVEDGGGGLPWKKRGRAQHIGRLYLSTAAGWNKVRLFPPMASPPSTLVPDPNCCSSSGFLPLCCRLLLHAPATRKWAKWCE